MSMARELHCEVSSLQRRCDLKSLRNIFLALAVAALTLTSEKGFAQQEVDPDHYDQPVAQKPQSTRSLKATVQHKSGSKTNVAKKRARKHTSRNA